jgi:hypothetical protein
MKIKKVEYKHDGIIFKTQYLYNCPGCGYEHAFALKTEGGHHDFNMDLNNPTVSPSLLQNFTPGKLCHSFIKGGKIQFLPDCQHSLAGQTVELEDIE